MTDGILSTPTTLRSATASARITAPSDEVVRDAARVAAALAVKHVAFWAVHLQPIPAHELTIEFSSDGDTTVITATLRAVCAMSLGPYCLAATTAAATCMHDLLSSRAPGSIIMIESASVVATSGGSGQFREVIDNARAVVIVLSDTAAAGKKPDTAGKSVVDTLLRLGFDVVGYDVIPDEPTELVPLLDKWLSQQPELILTVGGTGLGLRDCAVDVIGPRLVTEIPGMMEAARAFGQARTPYAMLSRGVAGLIDGTVVATFPGSRKGAEETLQAIAPGLLHLIEVGRMTRPHSGGYE